MFKWVCLTSAALFGISVLRLLLDLKHDVTASLDTAQAAVTQANEAVTTVNSQLPEIIDEVKSGTQTLSELAKDVKLIKSIAGVENDAESRDFRGLVFTLTSCTRNCGIKPKPATQKSSLRKYSEPTSRSRILNQSDWTTSLNVNTHDPPNCPPTLTELGRT